MIPKGQKGNFNGYRAQYLIDQNKVVLPDDVVEQLDNLDDVVFTYDSYLPPKPVPNYSKKLNKKVDGIAGYWIYAIQRGEPVYVKVVQTKLPQLKMGETKFRLKNLGGYYYKPTRTYYYRADSLEVVDDEN